MLPNSYIFLLSNTYQRYQVNFHKSTFRLKLGDDYDSLLIAEVLYSVHTVRVLDPEKRGPLIAEVMQ